ncbi:putative methyltransferase-domain-containing protein [Lentinula guzmanii]|uniref:Methyltransferase-domain-containing protein n=1 Tax=Lentinula guzmanii TaxID=2804957 RepID=A0AA38JGY7_9AGAR|nr:putative methyltransferase-domain-containing protein [Lentinula guzmanii]
MNTVRWEIFALLRDYASLVPARFIQIPSNISFAEMNRCLVELIALNPHFQLYAPSNQYQRSFWKTMVRQLEDLLNRSGEEDEEIDPRILDHYLSTLPTSGPTPGSSAPSLRGQICDRGLPLGEPPSKSFVTYFWKPKLNQVQEHSHQDMVNLTHYRSSTLEESRTTIEGGTTGLRTWFASHMLARYLIQNPSIVEGKCVLELGSGIGYLGIIVASLQQLSPKVSSSLWLTDVNEEVLSQCRRNVQLPCNISSTHKSVEFRVLDWEEVLHSNVKPLENLLQNQINPDVIIGADIVFDPALVPPLVAVIALVLQLGYKSGIQRSAIIALTVRKAETFQSFLDHAREEGLFFEDIPLPEANGFEIVDAVETGASADNVRVLRITLHQT